MANQRDVWDPEFFMFLQSLRTSTEDSFVFAPRTFLDVALSLSSSKVEQYNIETIWWFIVKLVIEIETVPIEKDDRRERN